MTPGQPEHTSSSDRRSERPSSQRDTPTTSGAGDTVDPSPAARAAADLPQPFGRYQIVRQLGGGGMGTVYLAHDTQLDRHVALKVPRFSPDDGPEVIERFYREARSMATLSHPHLCQVFDVGEIGGVHFLTMAYVEGQSLAELAEAHAEFEIREALELVRKLALALEAAHQADVIHRDLKLSNVMVNRQGEPVIVDFGLARRERRGESELTRTGAVVGTPSYMSPEQVRGELHAVGPACDIYALGVILYRLLTGSSPFEGDVVSVLAKILSEPAHPPSQLRTEIDPALDAVCLCAMAKAPADRFASMADFARALDGLLRNEPVDVSTRLLKKKKVLVPGHVYDLIVSYAEGDDEPPPGQTQGWVKALVQNVEWRLHQLCGRTDVVSVALAPQPGRDLSQQIADLQQSATLLVVLSPGYLESVWSQPELEPLLGGVQQHSARGAPVFLVERDRVPRETLPGELAGLRAHRFWEERSGSGPRILGHSQGDIDSEYYGKIDDLARHVHQALKGLRARAEGLPAVEAGAASKRATVYLAEVTDDLDPLRDEVGRCLDQYGFGVVPQVWYARDPQAFREAVVRDLGECLLCVQLLGPFAGKRPPGVTASYAALQYEAARAAGTPILQWRHPALDPGSVADPAHRALLEGTAVQAVDIEQFKREVVQRAERELERRAATSGVRPAQDQAFVFVNVEQGDLPLADSLCAILDRSGCAYALAMHEGKPDEIRRDLEANLLDCDGLIIVYGEIPEPWVREQLRIWRRMLHRREKPLRALAVYEGPPPEKAGLRMKLPEMRVIDCRTGLQEAKLQAFLDALAERLPP